MIKVIANQRLIANNLSDQKYLLSLLPVNDVYQKQKKKMSKSINKKVNFVKNKIYLTKKENKINISKEKKTFGNKNLEIIN